MHLEAIVRYPVKSLRGHEVRQAEVEPFGLRGDRRWMVVDAANTFQTLRHWPAMAEVEVEPHGEELLLRHPRQGEIVVSPPAAGTPTEPVTVWRDTVAAAPAAPPASAFVSAALGFPARLVYMADTWARPLVSPFGAAGEHVSFADGFPLLLTTQASLADLNGRLPAAVPMERFRSNLVLAGAAAWSEDTWRVVQVGAVRFRVAKPCERCVVVTRDPLTGAQPDPREPLRTLGRFHRNSTGGIVFGQNLVPLTGGVVTVGDPVVVLASGPSNLL